MAYRPYRRPNQGKQATFFIRITDNPIIREEFCASDKGVIFIKTTQSENLTSRLKTVSHVVRLSVRSLKKGLSSRNIPAHEETLAGSDRGLDSSEQNTAKVNDLVEFLQSQEKESQWLQAILTRQLQNLQNATVQVGGIPVHPVQALSLQRTRRNLTEIHNRGEQLRRAVGVLSGTIENPDSRLVLDLIKFLRRQAADMKFAAEEAQKKIRKLSETDGNEEVSESDPYIKAITQKVERENRTEQYQQVAEALSQMGRELSVAANSSPLGFWKRI